MSHLTGKMHNFQEKEKVSKNVSDYVQYSVTESNILTDVTLVSDEKSEFLAHKTILSACSIVLREVLVNSSEAHPTIFLQDVSTEILQLILEFMYTGEIKTEESKSDDLLSIGKSLKIKWLYKEESKIDPFFGKEEEAVGEKDLECEICGNVVKIDNCGRRSKILGHYVTHFHQELEIIALCNTTDDKKCKLCNKMKLEETKTNWYKHFAVFHDLLNPILVSRGLKTFSKNPGQQTYVDTRTTQNIQKVTKTIDESSLKANSCRICGQTQQNKKRLIKHYCVRHFVKELTTISEQYFYKSNCKHCDVKGVLKTSSKLLHVGYHHQEIVKILNQSFGGKSWQGIIPKKKKKADDTSDNSFLKQSPARLSDRMQEIENLGNVCYVCGKEFKLFRSALLPHYAGHYYKLLSQDHEDYFQDNYCKLCKKLTTKTRSKIIHLAVQHERVLPFIEDVIKTSGQESGTEADQLLCEVYIKEEQTLE